MKTTTKPKFKKFKLLSIDAWADGESWTWNEWHTSGHYRESEYGPLTNDSAMTYFFENVFNTSSLSRDEITAAIELEDDQYNIVLKRKEDQRPLWAIEYGYSENE